MYQGTTPTFLLTIAGYDLTDAAVFVTLENGSKQITLSGQRLTVTCEAETTSIIFGFSQEETFRLPTGTMKCQVRWVDAMGDAYVTEAVNLTVEGVLLKKVISYEAGDEDDGEEVETDADE